MVLNWLCLVIGIECRCSWKFFFFFYVFLIVGYGLMYNRKYWVRDINRGRLGLGNWEWEWELGKGKI